MSFVSRLKNMGFEASQDLVIEGLVTEGAGRSGGGSLGEIGVGAPDEVGSIREYAVVKRTGNLVSVPNGGSMTSIEDSVENGTAPLDIPAASLGGPQSPIAREICRGVVRVLAAHGLAAIAELPLPNGRRADVVGLGPDGAIWIVEIKSSLEDFRCDHKWPEYRDFSDRLFFAVRPGFPLEILPADTGLIVADRYGGEVVRAAPDIRLAAPKRKAMTLRLARASASRLSVLIDPTLPAAVGLGMVDV